MGTVLRRNIELSACDSNIDVISSDLLYFISLYSGNTCSAGLNQNITRTVTQTPKQPYKSQF